MSAARARPSLGCMHDHAPGLRGASNRRLLTLSLIITASVMIVQIVGAALTGSLALLADAGHMFADTAALVIALLASIVAARPANASDPLQCFGCLRSGHVGNARDTPPDHRKSIGTRIQTGVS